MTGEATILIAMLLFAAVLLAFAWSRDIGPLRGISAAAARFGWTIPVLLALFPETATEDLPRTVTLRPLHILVDDSDSMKVPDRDGGTFAKSATPLGMAEAVIAAVSNVCPKFGCDPKIQRLSEQDKETSQGLTPLNQVLEPWLFRVGGDPWLVISDGGDSRPAIPWDKRLRGMGKRTEGPAVAEVATGGAGANARGMIIGTPPTDKRNIWITSADVPPFSFDGKPIGAQIGIKRAAALNEEERVQVQVLAGDIAVATANAEFAAGSDEAAVPLFIPPIAKGQHLLTVKALPTAHEKALWDNVSYTQLEVLPNTVGVLHLLGSPSWDGRFLRRYLKSEPKYDLISFFILRDPWDSQQANERELSLIPFPVERLFREELPNFRVVIIQNFTLFQFLLPEYQNNLVKFVQDGGGLLFIGGPRGLQLPDLTNSPLKAILPFEVTGPAATTQLDLQEIEALEDPATSTRPPPKGGPAYDPNLKFHIELAQPDAHRRALANVYDDWEQLAESLTSMNNLKGMHRTDQVKFKEDHYTPLLTARTEAGGKLPLAVASYPGKGRALWVFSDSFWKVALNTGEKTSRQVYHQFTSAAMTWLMRQDLKKPLLARDLVLRSQQNIKTFWRVALQGPATRYFRPGPDWRVTVCGVGVAESAMSIDKTGVDEWELSGVIPRALNGGDQCAFDVDGTHPAFGSVRAHVASVFPETFSDRDIGAAPHKLAELATLTGAKLSLPPEDPVAAAVGWVETIADPNGIVLPGRFKTHLDHFWALSRPWFWLLLLCLPLEVILRRWHLLFSSRKGTSRAAHELVSGISLIELMVVISVTAILIAVAIPRYQAFVARSRQMEAKATLAHIATLADAEGDLLIGAGLVSCTNGGGCDQGSRETME